MPSDSFGQCGVAYHGLDVMLIYYTGGLDTFKIKIAVHKQTRNKLKAFPEHKHDHSADKPKINMMRLSPGQDSMNDSYSALLRRNDSECFRSFPDFTKSSPIPFRRQNDRAEWSVTISFALSPRWNSVREFEDMIA